jgi:hypothetical protein
VARQCHSVVLIRLSLLTEAISLVLVCRNIFAKSYFELFYLTKLSKETRTRTNKHLVLKHYQRMLKHFCINYVDSKNNGVIECTLQLFREEL